MASGSVIVKNTLTRRMQKISLGYRQQVMTSIAQSFTNIRRRADAKYIIPKLTSLKNEQRKRVLYKAQPSSPTHLTYRSEALKRMLLENVSKWQQSSKRSMLQDNGALRGEIRVTSEGTSADETYVGMIKLNITEPRNFSRASSKNIKKDLIMRFKHDFGGIRGIRRPFLSPATKDEEFKTQAIVAEKLKAIGV